MGGKRHRGGERVGGKKEKWDSGMGDEHTEKGKRMGWEKCMCAGVGCGRGKRDGHHKNEEFNVHTIGLSATHAKYEMLFIQFTFDVTQSMEKTKNRGQCEN